MRWRVCEETNLIIDDEVVAQDQARANDVPEIDAGNILLPWTQTAGNPRHSTAQWSSTGVRGQTACRLDISSPGRRLTSSASQTTSARVGWMGRNLGQPDKTSIEIGRAARLR